MPRIDVNRLEYEKRVNRVVDHIGRHLGEALGLRPLARLAAFSPFHFHRVFRAITGEPLFGYIQRLRIEKAAWALATYPDRSVLEIALDHGFSSAATFARSFRAHFGMSATGWRAQRLSESNTGKPFRKPRKARRRQPSDTADQRSRPMTIQVRTLPAHHVAYMRYVGPYGPGGIPDLWARFRGWTQARNLGGDASVKLGVAYDDPSITAPAKCRYDACVVVPADFPADRWVNVMDVPGGRYAVAAFTGSAHEIEDAWDRVFRSWLPDSGYQPDDRPCFELYRGDPEVGAKAGAFRCDLCLPVRPL